MIAKLNLASQPFRNRTLPWVVALLISGVSLLALIYFVAEGQRVRAEADATERQVQTMRAERDQLTAQATQIRETMSPEQRETLAAAHALVDRKSFSWSQLFADLEASLPTGVRVSRISVRDVSQRGEQTRCDLDLTVVGRTPTDVTGMIADMGRIGFAVIPLTENQRSAKGESGFEWTLRVNYVQGGRRTSGGERDATASLNTPAESDSVIAGRESKQ
ncbi:MAG: hypothetical protein LC754_11170 [Acidobacteria bacterium]|nr:hypothetical protein [Acidobacteriota bacterium]